VLRKNQLCSVHYLLAIYPLHGGSSLLGTERSADWHFGLYRVDFNFEKLEAGLQKVAVLGVHGVLHLLHVPFLENDRLLLPPKRTHSKRNHQIGLPKPARHRLHSPCARHLNHVLALLLNVCIQLAQAGVHPLIQPVNHRNSVRGCRRRDNQVAHRCLFLRCFLGNFHSTSHRGQ
jgi:hypothetical protein